MVSGGALTFYMWWIRPHQKQNNVFRVDPIYRRLEIFNNFYFLRGFLCHVATARAW